MQAGTCVDPWIGYDAAAQRCAERYGDGSGDAYVMLLQACWFVPADVMALIEEDTDAFAERVRGFRYAAAMEKRGIPEYA